jgi:hypothetical protein
MFNSLTGIFNLMKRLILSIILLIMAPTSLKATDLYFFDGLDAFIQDKLSAKGYPSALYYSPSLRFIDAERIKNVRLVSNNGEWKPEFPVHFQAISFNNCLDFCPQDPISAIIQFLFPSPGGIALQPNQTISDPISLASFKTLGTLLRQIEEGCIIPEATTSGQILRDSLYQLFPLETLEGKGSQFNASALNLEGCLKYYDDFLRYDFKKNLSLYLATMLTGVSEEDLEGMDFSHDDPDKYTKALKSIDASLFERKLLKDKELEGYILYWNTYNKLKTYSGKKLTLDQQSELDQFKETYKDYLLLEENKIRFKKVIFVETLMRALSQQKSNQENYSYPAFIVQRALIGYFWMKAKNESHVADWFSGLLKISSEEVMSRIKSRFLLHNYGSWKTMILEQSPESKELLLNPEKIALLSVGYQLFDAFFPSLIPYGTSRYKDKPFADCVENSCFNYSRFISRRKGPDGYYQDIKTFPPTSLARKLFERCADPSMHFSREIQDEWATMLSARKGIVYCKPTTAIREKRDYEVKSGIINILNCLTLLFANSVEKVSLIHFEDGDEALKAAMGQLAQHASNDGFIIEAALEDDPLKDQSLKDYFGDIVFKVNGKKRFTWHIGKIHSDIEVCEDETDDWRKTLSIQHLFSTLILQEMSPWFLSLASLKETFLAFSPAGRASVCYGMDVKPLKTKLALIKIIFEDHYTPLENFAHSLIKLVLNLDDLHAKNQLISMLFSLVTGANPVLNDEKMCSIISRNPRIMEGTLETQELPNPATQQAILWAYENNKKKWVELSASAIKYLTLESRWEKLAELLFMLPYFKKLESLNLADSWQAPLNEFHPLLYSSLPLLESLDTISLSSFSSEKMHIMKLLDHLPPKLKSLSLISSLKEEELQDLIKAFFKKVPRGELGLSPSQIQSDQHQALAHLQERLQEFAKSLGIPQDQLILNYVQKTEQIS